MEKDEDESFVKTFDEFYTTNHIQIMKSLLPYLGSNARKTLPIIIKYMELQNTIQKINAGNSPWDCFEPKSELQYSDFVNIYQSVKNYLSPDEDQTCMQLIQFKSQMENMKQMQEMLTLFQEINNDDHSEAVQNEEDSNHTKDSSSQMDILKLMQFMKDFS